MLALRTYASGAVRRHVRLLSFGTTEKCWPDEASVLRVSAHGSPLDVIRQEKETLPNKLSGKEVVVKMLASPINPADINMIAGSYGVQSKLPYVGGFEGVGQVLGIGPDVKTLRPNDWVIPFRGSMGTWRTHGVCNEEELQSLPSSGLSVEVAATIGVNPCTAFRMLHDFVDLDAGDVILQNGANSGVGQAVIQIAHSMGIKTVNIFRQRDDAKETAQRLASMGGDINVTDEFAEANLKDLLSDLPEPKLALNCVGGTAAAHLAKWLGSNGKLVTYGGMSKKPVMIPTSQQIFRNISAHGFWMTKWVEDHTKADRAAMLNSLLPLARNGVLRPHVESFDGDDYVEAFKAHETAFRGRKILLNFNDPVES